jgi:energy-coupling factor transporter transmembrane protein EcfT
VHESRAHVTARVWLFIAYLLMNCAFIVKYGARVFTYPEFFVAAYTGAIAAALFFFSKLPSRFFSRGFFLAAVGMFCLLMFVLFQKIPQDTLE